MGHQAPEIVQIKVVELVAPVGGGGQPEPPPSGDLPDGVLERGGRDVVALIGDDQPIPGGQRRDVVAAGQGLQGDDVDSSAELGPAAAELPGFHAEELADPRPPLVGQALTVDQDERGDLAGGDDRAGHDGLAAVPPASLAGNRPVWGVSASDVSTM